MALADIPVGDADISCLTNINSGAAPLSLPFELSFEKNFGVEVGKRLRNDRNYCANFTRSTYSTTGQRWHARTLFRDSHCPRRSDYGH